MDIVFAISSFVLGACMGSFINASVFRLASKQDIVKDRSKCPKCLYQLKWFDLIPIISYSTLKGKCRSCKKSIPYQYLLAEIISGSIFLLTYYPQFSKLQ